MHAKQKLDQLQNFFNKLFQFSMDYPRSVLAVTCIMSLAGFLLSLSLRQSVSIQELLEPSMKSTIDLVQMQKDFGSTNILLATFKNIDSSKKLCDLEIGLNDLLVSSGTVESFSTPLQIRQAVLVENRLVFQRVIPS